MSFRVGYCMHRGTSPRQQDAVLVGRDVYQSANLPPTEFDCGDEVLLAVADGLAVSPNAALASHFILKELPRVLQRYPVWCQDGLVTGRHIRETHSRMCSETVRQPRLHGSASTIVAAHLLGERVAILNSGDSRAYLRRATGDVRRLSRDHTELERLRDDGALDECAEYASFYGALSDCLVADSLESEFAIHRATLTLGAGDILVLCTDGVHEVLGDAPWRVLLARHTDPAALMRAARDAVLLAGAPDNFSVIALRAT